MATKTLPRPSPNPLRVSSLTARPTAHPELVPWHTTRHATRRHQTIDGEAGAPWQSRFDWVLDYPLVPDENAPADEVILTKLRELPRFVFCRAGQLRLFRDRVLPLLEHPFVLYLGNCGIPLSAQANLASRLVTHPLVLDFFAENKDIDISRVRAMPVGLHPADLLSIDGRQHLGKLAARPELQRAAAVLTEEAVLEEARTAGTNPPVEQLLRPLPLGRRDRWRALSRHRFALVDWNRNTESLGVFEALSLGTIPIVRRSPLSECHRELPVVQIDDLNEITGKRLEQWWRQQSPALSNTQWIRSDFWWDQVKSAGSLDEATSTTNRESTFPEHWYPPRPETWERESQLTDAGLASMRNQRVVFCGLARNVERALPRVIQNLERCGSLFRSYRVVVFENDSEDRTGDLLETWADRNSRVQLLRESFAWPKWEQDESPARMAAMAKARNRLLDAVADLEGLDYVIVTDLDLPKGFSTDGLATTFARSEWDAVGSNSLWVPPTGQPPRRPLYFDTWALDLGTEAPTLGGPAHPHGFERGGPLVPVRSSFGGLAVYRFEAYVCGARYAGPRCEHIAFHEGLQERGYGRHFLNPSQVVLYAADEPWTDPSDPPKEPPSPRRFVIVSSPRSGTHMLRTALNSHPHIACHAEVFNPDLLADEPHDTTWTTNQVLEQRVFRARAAPIEAAGFAVHRSGAPLEPWSDVWDHLVADENISIILLRRDNLFERLLSFELMRERIRGENVDPPQPREIPPPIVRAEFKRYTSELSAYRRRFANHRVLEVSYEDLRDRYRETSRRLQRFLGVANQFMAPTTPRNPPKNLRRLVTNYSELCDAFSGSPWESNFDLAGTE